eukprot:6044502-Prymnesium_polylepis.1
MADAAGESDMLCTPHEHMRDHGMQCGLRNCFPHDTVPVDVSCLSRARAIVQPVSCLVTRKTRVRAIRGGM